MCESKNGWPGCIVEQLLQSPFSKRLFQDKRTIIDNGRPTPPLNDLMQDFKETASCRGFTRHFRTTTYERCHWLTGCPQLNRLFCWPCILFSEEKLVWNTKGYADLGSLSGSILRHERTQNHIRSFIALKTFGGSHLECHLSPQLKLAIEKHNKKVKNNRDVVQRFINIATVLAGQELQGRCEDTSDGGNYTELVNLVKGYDVTLATHLETSAVFSDISSHIHNDLLDAVSTVMLDQLRSEINQASFITVMFDETSDVSNAAHLSVVLKYVSKEGRVNERFMGFADHMEDRTAASLSEHLFTLVDRFNCGAKLVAQIYDGAVVLPGELSALQAKVKEKYPCATFLHTFTHDLNLVLSQACGRNKYCNIFFSTLNGLASFFSTSAKRTKALDAIVQRLFPNAPPPRWDHTSRQVQSAQEHYSSLVELFNNILNEPHKWDSPSVLAAGGFLCNLEDDTFRFLLQVFADIFAHTDVLVKALQSNPMDVGCCVAEVNRITEQLQRKQLEYHDGYAAFATVTNSGETPTKKFKHSVKNEDDFLVLYIEIFATILSQLNTRFGSLATLTFLELLCLPKYCNYIKSFPENALESLKDTYGPFFDMALLRSELVVLYSSKNMAKMNIAELFSYMVDSGVQEALGEVYKLCSLFATISSTTLEGERSALSRIKRFTRSAVDQERLSVLGLMAIERDLLTHLKSESTFYDHVIEHYVKKNHYNALVYK